MSAGSSPEPTNSPAGNREVDAETMSRIATHRGAVRRWIAEDVDAGDRAELQRVLDQALAGDAVAGAELASRMRR